MASTPQSTHIPVLVVGGGVVGLSASLFLNHHGIRTILIEKHAGTSIHPRSRGVNTRTMVSEEDRSCFAELHNTLLDFKVNKADLFDRNSTGN